MTNILFTETFESLDTLTVTEQLVEDADKFFELCENCIGANFLKVPIQIKRQDGFFKCGCAIWFDPTKPSTISEWILFYLERALWIQFKAHTES